MCIKNKRSRKTINLNKSYKASTRFVQNENGEIEQKTVLYEDYTGSQIQPIYKTKHCEVQVTKSSILMRFKFDRKRLPMHAIESYTYNETGMITDFLTSDAGGRAIETADNEIAKIESKKEASI